MPGTHTYPGVYIEEIPSGVRTIVGVSTSNTAFIDYFAQGPVGQATRVTSFTDFQRRFGGLDAHSEASYAIQQFYLNGGQIAWVVRVTSGNPATAFADLAAGSSGSPYYSGPPAEPALVASAASPGSWGNSVQVRVVAPRGRPDLFNLLVRQVAPGAKPTDPAIAVESFTNLGMNPADANYAVKVVNAQSNLVVLADPAQGAAPGSTGHLPAPTPLDAAGRPTWVSLGTNPGSDGDVPPDSDGVPVPGSQWAANGPAALLGALADGGPLDRIAPEIFNILCIPAAARFADKDVTTIYTAALEYCAARRAFCILDLPGTVVLDRVSTWLDDLNLRVNSNGAVYYPDLVISDQLAQNRDRSVGPSGTVAGIYARTDATRGVWKAPAGVDAVLAGARLPLKLVDLEIGEINPEGINALRAFPIIGNVVWGARTLLGADQDASEWKYIPIRRLALFIEETLYESTKWVVFEPNDEPLWASIRLNVGAFMHSLFVQGAFQGQKPQDAYFVRCDATTTTQEDRDLGIVNILVGFAPLKPAEFVVIQIQQIAGAIQT